MASSFRPLENQKGVVKKGLNGTISAGFLFSVWGRFHLYGGILIGLQEVLHCIPLSTDPLSKEDVDTHLI